MGNYMAIRVEKRFEGFERMWRISRRQATAKVGVKNVGGCVGKFLYICSGVGFCGGVNS